MASNASRRYRYGATSRKDMKHNLILQIQGEVLQPWEIEELKEEKAQFSDPKKQIRYEKKYRADIGAERALDMLEEINQEDIRRIKQENAKIHQRTWGYPPDFDF